MTSSSHRTEPALVAGQEHGASVAKVRNLIEAARFGDHNHYLSRADREDAIHNPERHFWLHGVKMLSLTEVKRCKLMRDESDFQKDIMDAVSIDRLLDDTLA